MFLVLLFTSEFKTEEALSVEPIRGGSRGVLETGDKLKMCSERQVVN